MSIENLCLLENVSEIVGLVFLLIFNATVLEQVVHAYVTEFTGFMLQDFLISKHSEEFRKSGDVNTLVPSTSF